MTNRYRDWFGLVVWFGVLANWAFALWVLFLDPHRLLSALNLGPQASTIWLYNYVILLIILSCFYIPAARDPLRYRANAWLLIVGRLLPSSTFFLGVFIGFMPGGFVLLGIGDGAIGLIELFLLRRIYRTEERVAPKRSLFSRLLAAKFRVINRFISWHKLPTWVAVLNLLAYRDDLRAYNLHDTSTIPAINTIPVPPRDATAGLARMADGTYNDPHSPHMGRAMSRFGRNVPLDQAWPDPEPELLHPSPREVSRKLMTRDVFKPASTLNILAAAWIQFQNHGWFNHIRNPQEHFKIPLQDGDNWHENPMRIERTRRDATRADGPSGQPPTFLNDQTHWWDASQLYGSNVERQKKLRSGIDGKLCLEAHGLLPLEDNPAAPGVDLTGFNDNWWIGLSLLHTLFAHEHNAICDRLKRAYDTWDDERLFATARQINAALIAKIHTVEWTPGILAHPALQIGMNANWWGLVGERLSKLLGRLSDSEAISGIPGSPLDHHGVPFALTEEFAAVYRLHPLIPDQIKLYAAADGSVIDTVTFTEVQGRTTRSVVEKLGMVNLFYSLGVDHPGAITLHNFPASLQHFERIDGSILDVAAIDVMRDRERGVPRYNAFRQALRMPRIDTFEKLTTNRQWAKEIRELYNGDIDKVDLLVGMLAEPLPKGFGFSDTAFRIFILMASRRLKSDRFFTNDYTPEVYTAVGLEWLNTTTMKTILQRHFPELTPAFQHVNNVFAPWTRVQ